MMARVLAAAVGGYVLAHLLPLALVALLPVGRADAVLIAVQLGFAVHAAVILWCFAARTALRAWGGLVLAGAPAGLVLAATGAWA